jgi:Flp pilus assembly protein TadG
VNERRTHRNPEKGQSLTEFAISVVILLILLAGTVDAGRAFFTFMALRDAVQEGALWGSYNPAQTELIKDRVRRASNLVQAIEDDPNANLTIDVDYIGTACTGNGIIVQATYQNFPITMPFLGAILGTQEVPISASVTDTILVPPCD